MKDPRAAISRETYVSWMNVVLVLLALWILVGIWFDYPGVLDKIAASVCILVAAVVLTWPLAKDKPPT